MRIDSTGYRHHPIGVDRGARRAFAFFKMIQVTPEVSISESELKFTASRSSGPGGQNVNKVSSRVSLTFDLKASPSLSDDQKKRILRCLSSRINKEGVLRIASQEHRTQAANRRAVVERFVQLLAHCLRPRRLRRHTAIPERVRLHRLREKSRRSELKRLRATPKPED
ncbi:MAG: alternative ribosome rescue aminoacyl-tRNA hydrolase ArfB [Acidobacteriota bacterium]